MTGSIKRVLVTGQRGYLGAAIHSELSDGYEVIGLTERLEEIVPASIRTDLVIHCAGALRYRKSEHSLSNEIGTANLMAGLAEPTPVIYISSRSVYRDQTDELLTENHTTGFFDSYSETKLAGEEIIRKSGHPYLLLRSGTLIGWGAGSAGRSYVTTAAKKMINGQAVTRYCPDRQHDFLDVKDAARLIHRLVKGSFDIDRILNLSGPIGSLHEVFDHMRAAMASLGQGKPVIKDLDKNEPKKSVLDNSKLVDQVGGFTFKPMGESITAIFEGLIECSSPTEP